MPAYGVLVINMWIGIFISQGLVRGCWLINEGLQIYRLFNNILAVITNIGLNVLFIPKFGIEGAALASLVSIFLATYVFPLFFKEVRVSSVEMITSIIPFYLITRSKK